MIKRKSSVIQQPIPSVKTVGPIFDYYLGLDNGTSATGIAVVGREGSVIFEKLPVKKEQSYTKEKHMITRIDVPKLRKLLLSWALPKERTLVLLEKPMINATRFRPSISAARALEAVLIVMEEFDFSIRYVSSREWQEVMLPKGIVGHEELKKASYEVGQKLFPNIKFKKDADSLLMAQWAKEKEL